MGKKRTNRYLGLLQEECAETIQIASKIHRFGLDSYHPKDPYTSNRALLEGEVGDVLAIISLLVSEGVLSELGLRRAVARKLKKLQRMGEINKASDIEEADFVVQVL